MHVVSLFLTKSKVHQLILQHRSNPSTQSRYAKLSLTIRATVLLLSLSRQLLHNRSNCFSSLFTFSPIQTNLLREEIKKFLRPSLTRTNLKLLNFLKPGWVEPNQNEYLLDPIIFLEKNSVKYLELTNP